MVRRKPQGATSTNPISVKLPQAFSEDELVAAMRAQYTALTGVHTLSDNSHIEIESTKNVGHAGTKRTKVGKNVPGGGEQAKASKNIPGGGAQATASKNVPGGGVGVKGKGKKAGKATKK